MSNLLISSQELHALINDNNTRIIDCRFDLIDPKKGRNGYLQGHIPNAVYADINHDLSSPETATSGRHPLPTAKHFQSVLQKLGITQKTNVILYDEANNLFASRFWWLLNCYGHKSVQLLNGGLKDYAAHFPLSEGDVEVTPSDYPLKAFDQRSYYTVDELTKALEDDAITLIDVRAADRYRGLNETIDPTAGHIKGALNLPFMTHLDDDAKFIAKKLIKENFKSFIDKDKPLVFSCGSGVTACHSFLALTLAGLDENAAIYPGSWSEWIKDPTRPIEK